MTRQPTRTAIRKAKRLLGFNHPLVAELNNLHKQRIFRPDFFTRRQNVETGEITNPPKRERIVELENQIVAAAAKKGTCHANKH